VGRPCLRCQARVIRREWGPAPSASAPLESSPIHAPPWRAQRPPGSSSSVDFAPPVSIAPARLWKVGTSCISAGEPWVETLHFPSRATVGKSASHAIRIQEWSAHTAAHSLHRNALGRGLSSLMQLIKTIDFLPFPPASTLHTPAKRAHHSELDAVTDPRNPAPSAASIYAGSETGQRRLGKQTTAGFERFRKAQGNLFQVELSQWISIN